MGRRRAAIKSGYGYTMRRRLAQLFAKRFNTRSPSAWLECYIESRRQARTIEEGTYAFRARAFASLFEPEHHYLYLHYSHAATSPREKLAEINERAVRSVRKKHQVDRHAALNIITGHVDLLKKKAEKAADRLEKARGRKFLQVAGFKSEAGVVLREFSNLLELTRSDLVRLS